MKKLHWTFRALICVGLLQAVSCTKTIDTATNDSISLESSSDATVANEFSNCKMRYIYHKELDITGNLRSIKGLFTYNSAGNLFSLTYTDLQNVHYYDYPSYHFFYDRQGRLRESRLSYYGGTKISTTHKYGYNSSNVIIVDTTFIHDDGGNHDITVSTLTYDSQGRIVKENIKNIQTPYGPLRPTRNPTYTYDIRGNLGVLGWKASSYDYKVSALRSHPIFMFLMRNYSRNNAAPQAKYNSRGLPLSLNPNNDEFFSANPIEKIIYDCQ